MSRLPAVFARAREARRKALVIYLTAGDPDHETSGRLMRAAIDAGADIIEVGMPWSDPSADGPAIQGAMQRALAGGGGLGRSLALCRSVRDAHPDAGLVLFGYANPIVIVGPEVFAKRAAEAGADAVLAVDYPPDEDGELTSALTRQGLDFIPLLAPTSTPPRVAAAAAAAGGFIYYVSFTGITGAALTDLEGPRAHVEAIRAATGNRLPVVVGFGVRTPEAARAVAAFADGVVVGSAAVEIVRKAIEAKRDPVPELSSFVRALRAVV
ncbi:MAG: tryptophan synthase subunit alpha [Myxococcales bacterium]|nr:tryptophan synthase subunit alpha [Myxococcales bacterium]